MLKLSEELVYEYDAIDMSQFEKCGYPKLMNQSEFLQFDGLGDGLFYPRNPLYGMSESFFVEIMVFVSVSKNAEQRFLHLGSKKDDPRMLFETRLSSNENWYLDTVLADQHHAIFLMDEQFSHPLGQWYKIKMIYQNSTISTFVNEKQEFEVPFDFEGIYEHGMSIGVRQNHISWFSGGVKYLRVGAISDSHV